MTLKRSLKDLRENACGAKLARVAACAILCSCMGASAFAQEWYLGVIGGFGYQPKFDVKGLNGVSGSTGFKNGAAIGVYGGDDMYRYWGGEVRYLFQYSDAKVSSGNVSTSFGAHTHILTGDILGHFRPTESRVRPFIIFGGGVKIVEGTGSESAAQPLGNLVALTHTRETIAVGDVGAGVKITLSKWWHLRFEGHDYIGHAPHQVIAVAPGASFSGISNDIIGTASAALTW